MIDNPTSDIYNAISNIDVFLYISILYDWGKYQWQRRVLRGRAIHQKNFY